MNNKDDLQKYLKDILGVEYYSRAKAIPIELDAKKNLSPEDELQQETLKDLNAIANDFSRISGLPSPEINYKTAKHLLPRQAGFYDPETNSISVRQRYKKREEDDLVLTLDYDSSDVFHKSLVQYLSERNQSESDCDIYAHEVSHAFMRQFNPKMDIVSLFDSLVSSSGEDRREALLKIEKGYLLIEVVVDYIGFNLGRPGKRDQGELILNNLQEKLVLDGARYEEISQEIDDKKSSHGEKTTARIKELASLGYKIGQCLSQQGEFLEMRPLFLLDPDEFYNLILKVKDGKYSIADLGQKIRELKSYKDNINTPE